MREKVLNHLGCELKKLFGQIYEENNSEEFYIANTSSIARRALMNLSLKYLVRTGDEYWIKKAYEQFNLSTNMTDQSAALKYLVNSVTELGENLGQKALGSFYKQWQNEPLVVDMWFLVQATCQVPGAIDRVKILMKHQAFDIKNPNKVRSLIGGFCGQNHIGFHAENGEGYEFLADRVLELDKLNPQIAARLLTPLTRWKKYNTTRQALMQAQLQRIKSNTDISKDVFEVVEKSTI